MTGAVIVHSMPLRVRYHECDPQGIVFNANYLAWADMAMFDTFKALFGSYAAITGRGLECVLGEANVRFHRSCRFDEELVVDVSTGRMGTTSFVLRYGVRRGEERVAEVVNRYVWVDAVSLRPVRPPDDVRAAFGPAEDHTTA